MDQRKFGKGTSLTVTMPWSLYVKAKVLCSDGKVRTTARIGSTADTFFSVPCAVKVKGKTVSGFLMTDTDEYPSVIKFYPSGRNGDVLPAWPTRQ